MSDIETTATTTTEPIAIGMTTEKNTETSKNTMKNLNLEN